MKVILAGTSVTVQIDGASIFGGAQTITGHAVATRHGLMIVSSSTTGLESVEYLKFTLAPSPCQHGGERQK